MSYEEGKATRLELLAKRLGPYIERARNTDYEWTQSPLADTPFHDRVVLEFLNDFHVRLTAVEELLKGDSPFERQ
jgi:hypothetical protein